MPSATIKLIMLYVIMLSVIKLNVIMLYVVAISKHCCGVLVKNNSIIFSFKASTETKLQ